MEVHPRADDPAPSPARTAGSVQIVSDVRGRLRKGLEDLPTLSLAMELLARIREGQSMRESNMLIKELGALAMHADVALDTYVNRYSRNKNAQPLQILRRHPNFRPDLLLGRTILELGCGGINPLGGLMNLLLAGAERVIGLDLEPIPEPALAACAVYRAACDALTMPGRMFAEGYPRTAQQVFDSLHGFDMRKLAAGDWSGIDARRAEFLQCSASDTGLASGSVHATLSASFLEHVPDMDAVVAEMARVLAPGGFACHRIDGVDHRSYGDATHALEFLTLETDEPIVFECNRIRPLDCESIFDRHGFDVVGRTVYEQIEVPDELRKRLVEPFRSMSDEYLGAVGVEFHLSKR